MHIFRVMTRVLLLIAACGKATLHQPHGRAAKAKDIILNSRNTESRIQYLSALKQLRTLTMQPDPRGNFMKKRDPFVLLAFYTLVLIVIWVILKLL